MSDTVTYSYKILRDMSDIDRLIALAYIRGNAPDVFEAALAFVAETRNVG